MQSRRVLHIKLGSIRKPRQFGNRTRVDEESCDTEREHSSIQARESNKLTLSKLSVANPLVQDPESGTEPNFETIRAILESELIRLP